MWKRSLALLVLLSLVWLPIYSEDVADMTDEQLWSELSILLTEQETAWRNQEARLISYQQDLEKISMELRIMSTEFEELETSLKSLKKERTIEYVLVGLAAITGIILVAK